MNTTLVRCFTTFDQSSGNPALIVQNDKFSNAERQLFAKNSGMPVVVFVSRAQNNKASIAFFYTEVEATLCVHGTLAAASVLLEQTGLDTLTFVIKTGRTLQVRKHLDSFQVLLAAQPAEKFMLDQPEIAALLELPDATFFVHDRPFMVASVGSPKLLVPVDSMETLAALKPNFERMIQWEKTHQVNGFYIYTPEPSGQGEHFYARSFNPVTGTNEDIATGVAAGALGLALKRNITIGQGKLLGHPSELHVSYESNDRIWVGGRAAIIKSPIA